MLSKLKHSCSCQVNRALLLPLGLQLNALQEQGLCLQGPFRQKLAALDDLQRSLVAGLCGELM